MTARLSLRDKAPLSSGGVHERITAAGPRSSASRRWFQAAWRLVRRAAGWVPFTGSGLASVTALYWTVRHYAVPRHDLIVLGLCSASLTVVGLCALCVLITAARLRFRRDEVDTSDYVLETGTTFQSGYRLSRLAWNPLVSIEWTWHSPGAAHCRMSYRDGAFYETVTAYERGTADRIVRAWTIRDCFGWTSIRFERSVAVAVMILPHGGRTDVRRFLRQSAAGDQLADHQGRPEGDFIEMRRYVPGDPLKLVLWKQFARTNELLVRAPERSLSTASKTLIYLASAAGDEPAAGICRSLLVGQDPSMQFVFCTDIDQPATSELSTAIRQLVATAKRRSQGGTGLTTALASPAQHRFESCILFLPPSAGPWLDHVCENLARFPGRSTAVVGVDGLGDAEVSQRRWWLIDEKLRGSQVASREAAHVCRRLLDLGVDVWLADRRSGRLSSGREFVDSADDSMSTSRTCPAKHRGTEKSLDSDGRYDSFDA